MLCSTFTDTAALRISWKFPESNNAKIASCRVFMLIENKNRSVNNDQNWFPVGGDTSRMSCTIPLVNIFKRALI